MRKHPVVLDLETKHTFREFEDPRRLGVTVVGLYDYATGKEHTFVESELSRLFPLLENSPYIIGFNIKSFDLPVLSPYYPGSISSFEVFDILEDIRSKIGRRISLNDLGYATLGKKKSGHGLMAIEYYKEGKWDELKKYCIDDVRLTRDLFDFGVSSGKVYYLNEKGKVEIAVDWKSYLEESSGKDTALTLPF